MSGERQGDREVIDRMTKRIASDGVPPDKANEKARESMRRVDQRLREEGRR